MFIFILLNLLILGSSFLVVYKILRIKGAVDSVSAVFILYLSQIVLIELFLGIFGILYLKNVFLLVLLSFASAYILTRKKELSFPEFNFSVWLKKFFDNKLFVFIFSVTASFIAVKLLINLLNPPFGWDSLNYHFTFPVEWFKSGNLNVPIVVFDDPSPPYYPLNGSLFYLWLIFPFKSVFLADIGQFPFFIIALISVFGISRKVGLSRRYAFYSSALFALIPNFFKQLQIAYVDIMVGSLFLVSVNFLLSIKDRFNFNNVLFCGLSLGLLIGLKTISLPFSILLIIPFLALLVKNYKQSWLGLVFLACIIIFGGFSYIRNFIEAGNPLYPLDFSLLNMHIFKGVMGKSIYSSHFISYDYSFSKMMFHEGLGAQAILFVLPGVFLALPLAFLRRKSEPLDFTRGYIFILPLLIYLVYRFIIPLGNLRYLYALLGLGMISGFYIVLRLNVNRLVVNILVLVCVFASISELAKRQELVFSVILSFLLFVCLVISKGIRLPRGSASVFLFFILLAAILLSAEVFYKKNEFKRYHKMVKYSGFWPDAAKAWDWLNSNTSGNNIAYTGRAVPFPLYGSGFKNNVYYVSVNKIQPTKVHYFKKGRYAYGPGFESLLKAIEQDNNYRGNADFNIWLRNLRDAKADYLFVYSLQQTKETIFPIEDKWAKSNLDKFELLFSNITIHIYKVIK